jgi:hypothetical protein
VKQQLAAVRQHPSKRTPRLAAVASGTGHNRPSAAFREHGQSEIFPSTSTGTSRSGIASKRVRALEEDARDHPPSREDVEKAQVSMDALGAQYVDAFRQQNIVAIAYPTKPIPAPLLPIESDALPATLEIPRPDRRHDLRLRPRIGAVVAMQVEVYFANGKRWWGHLHEKGGKQHEMPAHTSWNRSSPNTSAPLASPATIRAPGSAPRSAAPAN